MIYEFKFRISLRLVGGVRVVTPFLADHLDGDGHLRAIEKERLKW
jgi:hypothetical protein